MSKGRMSNTQNVSYRMSKSEKSNDIMSDPNKCQKE